MTVFEWLELRVVSLPLVAPYWSMITTLHSFDTLVAEVRTSGGGSGFGEAVIITGYTHETLEGAWAFLTELCPRLLGKPVAEAIASLAPHRHNNAHAVACLVSALEMAGGNSALMPQARRRAFPVLAPLHSRDIRKIPAEVEALLAKGFRTLKVKVGESVDADLARISAIQHVVAERATLRLDANQGFSAEDGMRFAASLDPTGIELLEQPCAAEEWDAAIRVREVSTVPMMLDESIYGEAEIERASRLKAAAYIKLKLVKCGGIDWLRQGLQRISALDMCPVLGNGVATEIGCWMEACAANGLVHNAGEMNGFLKPKARLFANPLPFEDGAIVIPAGYYPQIDREMCDRLTERRERIS